MALVVFPTASKESVMLLTSWGAPLISAIPPALSVIGPKESIAIIIPATESIDTAATAIPYKPANIKLLSIPAPIIKTGNAVDSSPTDNPRIILVPWPDSEALAIDLTG